MTFIKLFVKGENINKRENMILNRNIRKLNFNIETKEKLKSDDNYFELETVCVYVCIILMQRKHCVNLSNY
jgi:type IV secretory pathway VirB9-like protein